MDVFELGNGIFFSRQQVTLFLIPLSSISFVRKLKFSLSGFDILALLLNIVVLEFEDFLFSFKGSLCFIEFSISITLNCVKVFLESISLLDKSFKLLFKATLLVHRVFSAELKSFIESLVLFLKSANVSI